MNLNKKKIIYSLFLLSSLLISSCNKTSVQECSKLNNSDKQWVPYRNHDSIGFKNFLNDSVIYYIASGYKSQNISEGKDGVGNGTYCFEYNSIKLSFLNPTTNGLTDWDKSFSHYVQKENGITHVYGNAYWRTMNREIHCTNPGVYFDLNCSIKYDSLVINGEWIKDVYQCNYFHIYGEIDKIFLNHQKGIVKIIFLDGQEFELIEHIRYLSET